MRTKIDQALAIMNRFRIQFRSTRHTLRKDLVRNVIDVLINESRIYLTLTFAESLSEKRTDHTKRIKRIAQIAAVVHIVSDENTVFDDNHFDSEGNTDVVVSTDPEIAIQSSTSGGADLVPLGSQFVTTSDYGLGSLVAGGVGALTGMGPLTMSGLSQAVRLGMLVSDPTDQFWSRAGYDAGVAMQVGADVSTYGGWWHRLKHLMWSVSLWGTDEPFEVKASEERPRETLIDQVLDYYVGPSWRELSPAFTSFLDLFEGDWSLFQLVNPLHVRGATISYQPPQMLIEGHLQWPKRIEGTLAEIVFPLLLGTMILVSIAIAVTSERGVRRYRVIEGSGSKPFEGPSLARFIASVCKEKIGQLDLINDGPSVAYGTAVLLYSSAALVSFLRQGDIRVENGVFVSTADYAEIGFAFDLAFRYVASSLTKRMIQPVVSVLTGQYRRQLELDKKQADIDESRIEQARQLPIGKATSFTDKRTKELIVLEHFTEDQLNTPSRLYIAIDIARNLVSFAVRFTSNGNSKQKPTRNMLQVELKSSERDVKGLIDQMESLSLQPDFSDEVMNLVEAMRSIELKQENNRYDYETTRLKIENRKKDEQIAHLKALLKLENVSLPRLALEHMPPLDRDILFPSSVYGPSLSSSPLPSETALALFIILASASSMTITS